MENSLEVLHSLSFLHAHDGASAANFHAAASVLPTSSTVTAVVDDDILSPFATGNMLDDAFGSSEDSDHHAHDNLQLHNNHHTFDDDITSCDDENVAEPASPASNLSSPTGSVAPSAFPIVNNASPAAIVGSNAIIAGSPMGNNPNLNSRNWRLVHLNSLLLANKVQSIQNLQYFIDKVSINVRTRSENSSATVPERLYSSLKYEMKHCVQSEVLLDSTNVLMCKVEIVNPEDHQEEILNTNGQKLIKGIQEITAMSRNASGSALECKMKIQFTSVSYHHEKKYFAFKVSFIDPLIHVSDPVLVLVSGPFQVFARRPTSRTSGAGEEVAAAAAPAKKESSSATSKATKANKKQAAGEKKRAKQEAAATSSSSEASSPVSPAKKQKPLVNIQKPTLVQAKPAPAISAPALVAQQQPAAPQNMQIKSNASLNDFVKCLDLLIAFKNSLANDDQQIALQVAQQKLLVASSAASNNAQQMYNKKQQIMQQQPFISLLSDL